LIDWLINQWSIYRSIDWSIDSIWSIDQFIARSLDQSMINRLINSIDQMIKTNSLF